MQRTISSINKLFLTALAIIALSASNALAQSESADPQPLTLNEAIRLALENNNDIRTSRIDVEKAEFDLTAKRGAYDPQLFSENYFERVATPVGSFFGNTNGSMTTRDFTSRAGLSGLAPKGGGSYQIDLSHIRYSSDNVFNGLNPNGNTSSISASYTQPLMRGLKTDDTRRRIDIAKKNLTLTDVQFRQRATDVITHVEHAYWELVHALKNLQVQNEAVKQTRAQVETNKRQVAQGVLAPIDVVEAEAQVKIYEQAVYAAQEDVTKTENALKTLLLADRTAALWSRSLLPVTPVNLEAPHVPLNDAVNMALENRFELAELRTSKDINDINKRFYRDQTKPQLDVMASYTSNADGPAWMNMLGQNSPAVRVGVRISLPLKNRTAKAEYGGSLAEGRRIESVRAQTEQQIEAEVRNAIQRVRSVEASMSAAAAQREAAEQQYTSEQRKFQAGMSTVFLVLQRQTDLVTARGRELETQTDLNKAISEFQRATGNTFRYRNVAVIQDGLRLQQTEDTQAKAGQQ